MKPIALCLLQLLVTSASAAEAGDIAAQVEAAHGLAAWWNTKVLRADVHIEFGGNTVLDGTIAFETNGARARLDTRDGHTVVYDGKTCWANAEGMRNPRFHVLTWSWFLSAPLKIRGHGSHLTPFERATWRDEPYDVARQTFEAGTGDTSDDWYDLIVDPDTHRLVAMGYIVTFGKSLADANAEPHAIRYGGFVTVDGVTLSTDWTFTMYTRESGLGRESIGHGRIQNLSFVDDSNTMFAKPDNAVEVPLP